MVEEVETLANIAGAVKEAESHSATHLRFLTLLQGKVPTMCLKRLCQTVR
jgi:hypothetical protein